MPPINKYSLYIDKNNYNDALKHVNIAKEINPDHLAPQQLYDIIIKSGSQ